MPHAPNPRSSTGSQPTLTGLRPPLPCRERSAQPGEGRTTSYNGTVVLSETMYKPFGEVRYTSGTLPTQYTFTGQYSNVADFGLMVYGAKWYDVSLGRFAQADTIIPGAGNPQSWDRYAYTLNNPVKYTDPTGHSVACFADSGIGCDGFGPSAIINAGFDADKIAKYLYDFMKSKPSYRVEYDPLIYGKNEEQLVRMAQFQVEAEKPQDWGDWTFQLGFGGIVFGGVNVRGDVSLAFDGKGNIGFLKSVGGGGDTSLGTNLGFFITVTNAPSIDKLKGASVQIGGQIGDGASFAGEIELFKDLDNGKIYTGYTLGGGGQLAVPWPFEAHGTSTYTWGNIRYRR